MPPPASKDSLQATHEPSHERSPATASSHARRPGAAAAPVASTARRRAEQGPVEHVPYHGTRLTGERAPPALRIRPRRLELFPVEAPGYPGVACTLRSNGRTAPRPTAGSARSPGLDESWHAPRGAPIPDRARPEPVEPRGPALAGLEGSRSAIPLGSPRHPQPSQQPGPGGVACPARTELGPGRHLDFIGRARHGGPLRVRVGPREQLSGLEASATVRVEPLPEARRRVDPGSHLAGGGHGETDRKP